MSASSTTKTIVNVAVIAFGMSAEVFHCPSISSLPSHFKLVACVERNAQKSKVKYPHIQVYSNVDDVLQQNNNIDLIIITTPNTSHFDLCKRAILAGKHVVVEKPFTCTSKEAVELCELAKAHSRVLSVYHNRRFDGDFLTVKKLAIDQGMLGTIVEFESHFDRFRNQFKVNAWREGNLFN